MADVPLRTLERTFAGGDESARVSLAAAYLRQGRCERAIELLRGQADLPSEALAVHEAAWRQELSGLDRAIAVPGTRPWERLLGWLGGGRYAVLGGVRTHVLDLERGATLDEGGWGGPTAPVLVADGALLARRRGAPSGDAVWVRPPAAEGAPWGVEAAGPGGGPAGTAESVRRVAPDGRRALVGRTYVFDLERWTHARPPVRADTADVDWANDRLVWWSDGRVHLDRVDGGGAPAAILDVRRRFQREHPARAAAMGPLPREPTIFRVLADGRLCIAPPLAVVDLDTADVRFPLGGRGGVLGGPARLSPDGEALLLFRGGRPVRVPIDGDPPELPPTSGGAGPEPARAGAGLWHPWAEVAATGPGPGGTPELRAPGAAAGEGEVVRALPRDARPLGWTPDGRGLLLVRGVGPTGGLLEVWRLGGGRGRS